MSESRPRPNKRAANALRPLKIETGVMKFAEGSALIELGDTRVMVSASVESRVPPFLVGSGKGWLTAEYAMLPRATSTRSRREVTQGRPSGRSAEIQRLIGRSLRSVFDLDLLGERTFTLDCDVLQADGGTRTAAITAAYVAAVEATALLFLSGDLDRWPVGEALAAVSVGIVDGQQLLDLEAIEDQVAEVDLNLVATRSGELIEIQGTGEKHPFSRPDLEQLLDLGQSGIDALGREQERVLAATLDTVEAHRRRLGGETAQPRNEADLWDPPAS